VQKAKVRPDHQVDEVTFEISPMNTVPMDISSHFPPNQLLAAALLEFLHAQPADAAHDVSHILRVWRNVLTLSAQEGGNLRILTAATLLHDCVNVPKDGPDRASASLQSARKSTELLGEMGWASPDIDAVAHAILTHSFSANQTPTTIEAKILQDADRLDALGHIGIARCFFVSGHLGRPLYDPQDPRAEQRMLDDGSFALDHFQTKLLSLSDGFQTKSGQILAQQKHVIVQEFFEGLLREVSF
jgi:uncharacterized protein